MLAPQAKRVSAASTLEREERHGRTSSVARCAYTYLNNKTHGQWKAHGRYLARESAEHTKDGKDVGFSRGDEPVNIASRLDDWQKMGDQRLWKLIVSPEFGEKVDLTRLTRDLRLET